MGVLIGVIENEVCAILVKRQLLALFGCTARAIWLHEASYLAAWLGYLAVSR